MDKSGGTMECLDKNFDLGLEDIRSYFRTPSGSYTGEGFQALLRSMFSTGFLNCLIAEAGWAMEEGLIQITSIAL